MNDIEEAYEGRGVDPSKLTPKQRLEHVCGWYLVDPAWAGTMLRWVKDCGFKVGGSTMQIIRAASLLLVLGLAACGTQPPGELVTINAQANAMPYVTNNAIRFGDVAFSCEKGNCLDYALCKLRAMQKENIRGHLFVYRLWNNEVHAIAVSDTGWALDNRRAQPYPAPACDGVACWTTDVEFKNGIAIYHNIKIIHH